ncbi:hypothetical protein [Paraliomyxa miuraensis]|uniref:hypothetical protein n=1 Tax=Paraliomyxa miuraensis TaxID=376150 RepID=UPI002253D653|nr:hypothetical protein [Paraliomyxa miuraensis]MCX4241145.1 hypothetical protein [Paraliomyxa miuraensis]
MMTSTPPCWLTSALVSVAVTGCGPSVAGHDPVASGTGSTTAATSGSGGSVSSAAPSGSDSITTGDATASVDSTGNPFVVPPDHTVHPQQCDLFAQDCPRGEKCTPWADDGGPYWNSTRCVPVVADPAGTGEPCHVESSPTSGLDDCDRGAMCFGADPRTLEGICTPLCIDPRDPHCEDPDRYCPIAGDGVLLLCLETCDPLQRECPPAWACHPVHEQWVCVADGSGDMGAYGDPCEFINACDPGLVCLDSASVPPGLPCRGAPGCCTEVCDITDPLGDQQCTGWAEGQICQSWYGGGEAPMGLENVGVCALPP